MTLPGQNTSAHLNLHDNSVGNYSVSIQRVLAAICLLFLNVLSLSPDSQLSANADAEQLINSSI